MKVKSVTKIHLVDPVPVYDLSVPGTENLVLSNGLVVHNSKDAADAVCGAYTLLLNRASSWMEHDSEGDGRYSRHVDEPRFDEPRV